MLRQVFERKKELTVISIIALISVAALLSFTNSIRVANVKAEDEVWATLEVYVRFSNRTTVYRYFRIQYISLYKSERGEVLVPAETVLVKETTWMEKG